MTTYIGRLACFVGILLFWLGGVGASQAGQQTFASPDEAMAALYDLIGMHDEAAVERIFGVGSGELFRSGDQVADDEDYQRVKAMIAERVEFIDHDDDTKVAVVGEDAWPLPIPLVREGGQWRFDTENGREEMLNRRIGRNELITLAALREIVDAQREFASVGRDGRPPAFAQRFRSSEGSRDGLYWTHVDGEEPSPLGDLLAEADVHSDEPQPFHGYFFRILSAQTSHAPGGERSYVDSDGNMTGGFAVLAWPAKYGNSGIMSFQLSQRGIVFQKDLGEDTEALASAIEAFDPDPSWMPTRVFPD